jgi:hypothetical protein
LEGQVPVVSDFDKSAYIAGIIAMFVDLLTLAIASALGPGQMIVDTLLLLSPDRATLKAGSFVAGMTVVRLLKGLVFGFVWSVFFGEGHRQISRIMELSHA